MHLPSKAEIDTPKTPTRSNGQPAEEIFFDSIDNGPVRDTRAKFTNWVRPVLVHKHCKSGTRMPHEV